MIRFSPILILLLVAGCATPLSNDTWKQPAPPKQKAAKQATAVVVPEAPPKTRLLPLNARVISVKNDLRFVLIDFTNSRRPGLDERLNVYRVGQKVAEIKVSGPFLNTTVAADLLAGDARYGDEVKAE
jgi:hypothetical protein